MSVTNTPAPTSSSPRATSSPRKTMAWFWDAYEPEVERRMGPFASPLRASDEQLAGPPPAFLIVDEADVLRDEGEAYAARLRAAGTAVTTVRYDGTTHDFMMLNPLSDARRDRAGHRRSTQRPEHDLTSARCRATLFSDAARHSARQSGCRSSRSPGSR